jgi:hypothetical protein
MTVRIQKPAVNIREKLAELERPIGINGQALMATDTPQQAFDLLGAGRRNLIINGDFQVSQRGDFTTSAVVGSIKYQIDRWYSVIYSAASDTMQHKLNQVLPNGNITNSVRVTTGATGYVALDQYIENPSIYSGKTFTISFWIKTNCNTTEVNVYNGSLFALTSTAGRLNETSGDWKYFTRTFTMPSSGNTSFRVEFYTGNAVSSPSGSYIEVAQVQLEAGKVATPFEYRSYGQELALCQRYFQTIPAQWWWNRTATGTSYSNATLDSSTIILPVPMRATPTASRLSDGALFVTSYTYNSGYATVATRNIRPSVDSNSNGTIILNLLYNQADNSSTNLPTTELFGNTLQAVAVASEL